MKILLDPGHGGRDPGAVGVALPKSTSDTAPLQRLQEKDVTLAVAQRAAAALREHGYTVLLTRETDIEVPLYARTGMALAEQVDAYISIHANAAAAPAVRSGTSKGTSLHAHLPPRWRKACAS